MSKNKKSTTLSGIKKTLEKAAYTAGINKEDPIYKTADNVSSKLDSIIEASTDSIKEKIQDFTRAGTSTSNQEVKIVNNMITKLSNNIRHNFEQNMELSQDLLKCKTVADFIEFQRKRFETNYKNTVKLCNDLFYDMQELTNQNINVIRKYAKKD